MGEYDHYLAMWLAGWATIISVAVIALTVGAFFLGRCAG
jgi:hypothetical protein